MTDEQRSQHNAQAIQSLYTAFQPMVRDFIALADKKGYKLRITDGYRSPAEQNDLYAIGRNSKGEIIGEVVTNARGGDSIHQYGLAIDIYDELRGYTTDWDELEDLAKSLGIEHGDRGYRDLPHFQYIGGLSLDQVKSGKRPPMFEKYLTLKEEPMTKEEKEELESYKKEQAGKIEQLQGELASCVKEPKELMIYKSPTGGLYLYTFKGTGYLEIKGIRNMVLWLLRRVFNATIIKQKPDSIVDKFHL